MIIDCYEKECDKKNMDYIIMLVNMEKFSMNMERECVIDQSFDRNVKLRLWLERAYEREYEYYELNNEV